MSRRSPRRHAASAVRRSPRRGGVAIASPKPVPKPLPHLDTSLDLTTRLRSFVDCVIMTPDRFLAPSQQLTNECVAVVKALHDQLKRMCPNATGPLPQLLTDGFSEDQVWEQLRLMSKPLLSNLSRRLRHFRKRKQATDLSPLMAYIVDDDDDEDDEDDDVDTGSSDEDEDEDEEEDEEEEMEQSSDVGSDDEGDENDFFDDPEGEEQQGIDFFDMDAMEAFVAEAERDVERDPEEAVAVHEELNRLAMVDGDDEHDDDEHGDDGDASADATGDTNNVVTDDVARQARFDAFFDAPGTKIAPQGEEEAAEAAFASYRDFVTEDDRLAGSAHARQKEHMLQRVEQLEDNLMRAHQGDKMWAMKGEVGAGDRPVGSLLETVVDFEARTLAPRVITEETTLTLEEIIKKRIMDGIWDDVVRKVEADLPFKSKIKIDTSKSKLGLAELYQQQYLNEARRARKEAGEGDSDSEDEDSDEVEQLTDDKREMLTLFRRICQQLNAFSNFHYTPKPATAEVSVRPATAALRMEDTTPTAVSTANLVAPEEVLPRIRSVKAREELTRSERKQGRKRKKEKQKKRRRAADARLVLRAKLGHKASQARLDAKKAVKSLKSDRNVSIGKVSDAQHYKGSSKFFSKLQDDAKLGDGSAKKRRVERESGKSAAQFKL